MAKYAVVVMSEHGEANPGGPGRMVHALSAVKAFKEAGDEVTLWFHGIGVTWLAAFDSRYDQFTRNYGGLFDEVKDAIGGACDFCRGSGSVSPRAPNALVCRLWAGTVRSAHTVRRARAGRLAGVHVLTVGRGRHERSG